MSISKFARSTRAAVRCNSAVLTRLSAAASVAALVASTFPARAGANPRPVARHTVGVSRTAAPSLHGARLDTIGMLNTLTTNGSSQDPINRDQNPYELSVAPFTSGAITKGNLVICK